MPSNATRAVRLRSLESPWPIAWKAIATRTNTFDVSSLYLGGDPRRIAFGENGAVAVVSNYYAGVSIIR
jgi:hypothetical protein